MGVRADTLHLVSEALSKLRQNPEPGRVGAAEQGDEADGRAILEKLSRQLEGDRAAGTVAGNHIRTVGPECLDLGRKVCGQILNACDRLALAVETRGLQPEERLIVAQMPDQGAITEHIAIVPGDGKNG